MGMRERFSEDVNGCRCRRVACHYNDLTVPGEEKARYQTTSLNDLLNRSWAVGTISRIGHINQALSGEKRLDSGVNGQSANTGIHYSDG